MSKIEDARKKALKEAVELFADRTQEEANAYFTEKLMITQITKAHMAAYIKKYATGKEDKEWVKKEFKAASEKKQKKQVSTVKLDGEGNPVYKVDRKTGKVKPAVIRVDSPTGEVITTFDLSGARAEFIKHFNITPKANKFTPKAKRTEAKFDEFADLF